MRKFKNKSYEFSQASYKSVHLNAKDKEAKCERKRESEKNRERDRKRLKEKERKRWTLKEKKVTAQDAAFFTTRDSQTQSRKFRLKITISLKNLG